MRMSWKLGTMSGIDVFVHPTFLLVLIYSLMLGGGLFGLTVVLSAFGCVLLHEFGHALMARRFGIGTRDITLYPIGGVARLDRMPRSPGAELLIALAGPAVNLAIAGGLSVLGLVGLGYGATNLDALATQLILINTVLAVFNLMPAFPMDGGRVLRALLSGWLGRLRATQIAATLGRGLALAFGAYSLLSLQLIPMFLALFIFFAAGNELAAVSAEEYRRRYHDDGRGSGGVWFAPPGYRWVSRGPGRWQLCPIVAGHDENERARWR
jgi:Zn-dependent protease